MEFAYLDESGDSGASGSKKIVMCLICTKQRKKLNRIIRKTKQILLHKNKTAKWLNRRGEIKFYSFPDKDLLKKTLEKIAEVDLKIYYICFDKNRKKFNRLLKTVIMKDLFRHILEKTGGIKPQKVISDLDFFGKKPSYFSLAGYQKKKIKLIWGAEVQFTEISKEEYEENKNNKNRVLIKIEPNKSRLNEELQAVDLICGSIFQFVENKNSEYFNIIKKNIISGSELKQ